MQTFQSQYGRKGCRVDDAVPTYAIRRRLGRVHVGASDADVIRLVQDGIADALRDHPEQSSRWTETLIRQTIRYAVWVHHENRAEYAYVMGGC